VTPSKLVLAATRTGSELDDQVAVLAAADVLQPAGAARLLPAHHRTALIVCSLGLTAIETVR
jgi:hypothetical protein